MLVDQRGFHGGKKMNQARPPGGDTILSDAHDSAAMPPFLHPKICCYTGERWSKD
jgi:hypothetical protein